MAKIWGVIRYTSYITLTLILLTILSPAALAGNGAGADNNDKSEKTLETLQKKDLIKEENQSRNQSENKTLEQRQLREESQERKQLKEQLKIQRSNYQTSKKSFLAIRSQLRSGNYDGEDLEIVREYLNASIDYMIAHLEKIKYNIEQSNGNGTEERVTAIEDRIAQLKEEKKTIEKAEDLEELINATESVRGVWNNVRNRTAVETGETACEKINGFVDKTGDISKKLEKEIERLNETGVNTTGLEAKLANYTALMDSARENNEAAKKIYNKENATEDELQKADSYLQSALKEIKEANQVLKEIFGELEQYREQYGLEEHNQKTAQINGEEVDDINDEESEEGKEGDDVEDEEDIEDNDEEDEEDTEDIVNTNSSEEKTNK